jgi:hypothetical protein
MLDALKFAFEILIVGALALPWLAVLHRTFPSGSSSVFKFDLSFVPEGARNLVSVALVIAVGYLLGSAVSRFSRDFFNDELWRPLPTEDVIRDSVYFDEYCADKRVAFPYVYWSRSIHLAPLSPFCPEKLKGAAEEAKVTADKMDTPDKTKASAEKKNGAAAFRNLSADDSEVFDERVQEVFRLQDSELMLQGVDKVDRLKQYFDQITVLRGAAFNGFILFSLALFGIIGKLKERWSKHRVLVLLTFLPAAMAVIFTLYSFWRHWYHGAHGIYSDPPLAEIVILLVSAVGLYLAWRPDRETPYFQICIIAMIVMVVTFGGWWWTEVMYDLQVIHSLAEMKESRDANQPAAQAPNGHQQPSSAIRPDSPPAGSVPDLP